MTSNISIGDQQRIDNIKQQIAELSRAVKNTVDVMTSYRTSQGVRHDGWIRRLNTLEYNCRTATDQWNKMHQDKLKYAFIVDEEVGNALSQLHAQLHALLMEDGQRIEHEWRDGQQQAIRTWTEQQRTIGTKRKLVTDRLLHWERQIANMPGTEALIALIHDANNVQRGLDDAYHSVTATEQFVHDYNALVALWRMLYSQTKKCDARLTPDILRRL